MKPKTIRADHMDFEVVEVNDYIQYLELTATRKDFDLKVLQINYFYESQEVHEHQTWISQEVLQKLNALSAGTPRAISA